MSEIVQNYQEKGFGLHGAIEDSGHYIQRISSVWHCDDALAVQEIIDNYDELAARKAQKADEIKAEGLKRINAVFPALDSLDDIQLVAEQWLSIAPAARQPTVDFQTGIDIYSAAKAAIIAMSGMDLAGIQAFDPVSDVGWPA